MPSNLFDRLADELVLEIVKHLYKRHIKFKSQKMRYLNEDIWYICLCSRRFHRIGLPLLYHTVNIPHPRALYRFLRAVIEYPQYAGFVKMLALVCWRYPIGPSLQYDTTEFLKVAQKCTLPHSFITDIEDQYPAAFPFLLLHLLQRLEALEMSTDRTTENMIQIRFAKFVNARLLPPRLHTITLNTNGTMDVQVLVSMLLAPSITHINVRLLDLSKHGEQWLYSPQDLHFASSYGTSSIEKLDLRYVLPFDDILGELLRLPRSLKTFIYIEDEAPPSEVHQLDTLRQALNTVSNHLETMKLVLPCQLRFLRDYTSWSLAEFTSLKVLHIMYEVLFGKDVTTIPSINYILPPTLEILIMDPLDIVPKKKNYISPWKTILSQKSSTCVPRLWLIAHVPILQFLAPLVEFASNHNVSVALKKEELDSWLN
jgi:hypothetical protein